MNKEFSSSNSGINPEDFVNPKNDLNKETQDQDREVSEEENRDFQEKKKTVLNFLEKFFQDKDNKNKSLLFEIWEKKKVALGVDSFDNYNEVDFNDGGKAEEIKKLYEFLEEEGLVAIYDGGDEEGDNEEGDNEEGENDEGKGLEIGKSLQKFAESSESKEGEGDEEDGDVLTQMRLIKERILPLVQVLPNNDGSEEYKQKIEEILNKLGDPEIGIGGKPEEDEVVFLFEDFIDLLGSFKAKSRLEGAKIKKNIKMLGELKDLLEKKIGGVGGVEANYSSESNIGGALERYRDELRQIFELSDYRNELSENNGKRLEEITSKLDDKRRKGEIFTTEEVEEYKKLIKFIDGKMVSWKNASSGNQIKDIKLGSDLYIKKEEVERVEADLNVKRAIIVEALKELEIKDDGFRDFSRKSLKEMLEEFQNGHVDFNRAGRGEKYLKVYLKKLDSEIKKIPKNIVSKNDGESEDEFRERERLNEIEYKKKQLEMKILTQGFFSLIDSGLVSNNCIYANNLMVRKENYLKTADESPLSGEPTNQQKNTVFNYAVLDSRRLLDEYETLNIDDFKIDEVYRDYSSMESIFHSNNENGVEGKNSDLLTVDGVEFCTMDIYKRFYQKEVDGVLIDKEIDEFGFIDASEMPIVQKIVYAIYQEMTKEKGSGVAIDSIKSKFSAHIDFDSVGGVMEAVCSSNYMLDRFGRTIKLDICKELETFSPEGIELIKYIAKIKAARDNLKSEANFNLMARLGTSLQFNSTLRGESGKASHLAALLSQKVDDKDDHDAYFLMNRFLDTSEFSEKNIYKRVPDKFNNDGTYRTLTREDFRSTLEEKEALERVKEEFNSLSRLRMEIVRNKEGDGEIRDEEIKNQLRREGINDFEVDFVLRTLGELIAEKIKFIGDSQKCNPGMLAVENLMEADKYIHDRYQDLGIKKYKFKRDESYVSWTKFVNETEGVQQANAYDGSEKAYEKVMYGSAEMVKKVPQNRNIDDWNRFLGDIKNEDEDTIFGILAKAGAIKSYLAQTAVTGNPDVKYQYIWEQMRSAITYMIIGSLEKIPGVVQGLGQGNFVKNFFTGNKKNRDEYDEYKNFMIDIARKIKKKTASSKKYIPPFLVDEVNAILDEIEDGGPALDKLLNKYSGKLKTGNYFYKLNEYRINRDPEFMIRYKRSNVVDRGEMWTSIPDDNDVLNYGNTL